MNPCADDIAVAIVAACRETGEHPWNVEFDKKMVARHYAVHALAHVFRKASVLKLCAWVGVKHNAMSWWTQSKRLVEKKSSAQWWSDEAYDRVIRALEADRTRRNVAPRASVAPECVSEETEPPAYRPPPGTVEKVLNGDASPPRAFRQGPGQVDHSGYRPPKGTMEAILADDDRPIFDRSPIHERPRFRPHEPKQSKAELEAELRQAVLNTIARQKTDG